MKFRQLIFIILLNLLCLQFVLGQEKPKAELISSLRKMPCDMLKMATYDFLNELLKESTSTGYAIIYEGNDSYYSKISAEEIIFLSTHSWIPNDRTRLQIVYGEKGDDFRLEFWKVPNGAEKPKYLREGKLYSVQNSDKPFIFAISNERSDGCPDFDYEIFADVLKSNQNLKGHIVFFNMHKQIKENHFEYLQELFQKNKISRKQFKIFFINNRKKPSFTEFWLVPKKKPY